MEIKHSVDNCIKCGRFVHDAFVQFQWKGKAGYCCEKCGWEIQEYAHGLLDKAVDLMKKEGIDVVEAKEKFGRYELVGLVKKKKQGEFIDNLLAEYRKDHPDIIWDWRWF
jgi:hypothetical protein